jgi:hypothetical protein
LFDGITTSSSFTAGFLGGTGSSLASLAGFVRVWQLAAACNFK